ncbi:MAG: hypothetical protein DYG89_03485 [Caldilinea sp. CFX5]|nr:hypothetical protein [Caldilinea sp. CFX5]
MSAKSIWEASELLAVVRTLTPLQRQLLTNLADRGPGLLLEVAVRVLKFPEDVSAPLRDLSQKGLVRAETISGGMITGGQLGNELFNLSEQGRQAVLLLRDETMRKELEGATTRNTALESLSTPDPRQQEVELMRKLGDLAAQAGDLEKARTWYEEALRITRSMSEPPASAVTAQP